MDATMRKRIRVHIKIAIYEYEKALKDCASPVDRQIINEAKTDAEEILRWIEGGK